MKKEKLLASMFFLNSSPAGLCWCHNEIPSATSFKLSSKAKWNAKQTTQTLSVVAKEKKTACSDDKAYR